MTFAASETTGKSRQRSFWLRCFLGPSCLCILACGELHSQIAADKPLHIAHVAGYVVNSAGKPLLHAEITLDRDGKVFYRTRTDNAGAFRFDRVLGHYVLRVERTQYAPAERDIDVGDLIESYLQRRKLYVIVGPGACQDACSLVFTNKNEFENEIKRRTRKSGESQ